MARVIHTCIHKWSETWLPLLPSCRASLHFGRSSLPCPAEGRTMRWSETQFLLIGLIKQLDKIHNSSLNTTHSARNLGFIFDKHLTFSDQISDTSKACYYHIRQLSCICRYLDSNIACTNATSIVHSKLDYCNSLYYNLRKCQDYPPPTDSKLSPVHLLKLLNPVTSFISCALFTGLK